MNNPGADRGIIARLALPILTLGVIAIGLSPILVRLSEVGPLATAVNRMALPLPLFAAVLWLRPSDRINLKAPGGRALVRLIALSGLFFAGDLAFWHWAIKSTSVANATVLSNLAPVFVILGARLLFDERFGRIFAAGVLTAVAGMAVLMGESFSLSRETLTGDLLGVASSVFYGAYLLALSHARRGVSTAATMAVGGLAATIALWILAVILEGPVWPHSLEGWAVALGLALVVQVGGQTLIALSFAHVPAGFGSLVLLLQPIVAAALAWVLFDESLSLWQFVGATAILGGLEIARRSTRGEK